MNYIDITTLEYPLTARDVRLRVNASIPDNLFPPDGYAVVELAQPPAHDNVTQQVAEAAPAQVNGIWTQQWAVTNLTTEQATTNLAALIASSVQRIDAEVDAIYAAALGNRGPEYTDAEAAAVAYQAAGYTGTVPEDVQSWATPKGWTAAEAADDILAEAVKLRTAKSVIRRARLLRKEQVRAATTSAEVAAPMLAWAGFVAFIKTELEL